MPTSPHASITAASPAAGPDQTATTPRLAALMTVSEVATYLRVSEMTVYRLISSQQIGATKIGRGYRIPTQDLADYVDAGRVACAS